MLIECLACPTLGPSAPLSDTPRGNLRWAHYPHFPIAVLVPSFEHGRKCTSGALSAPGAVLVLPFEPPASRRVGSPRRLAEVSCPGQLQERWSAACHVHTTTPGRRIAWPVSRLVRTSVRGTGCVHAASRVRATRELLLLLLSVLWCEMQCRIRGRRGAPRMLYVLRRQEHVSVRMCASGVGEVASSPYTFVVGPGARWRPRCTRVDGGCLRRPTPRRLVFAWRSEARRLLDERERAIEPHLSFCCCRILFCWCWAFTRGGS